MNTLERFPKVGVMLTSAVAALLCSVAVPAAGQAPRQARAGQSATGVQLIDALDEGLITTLELRGGEATVVAHVRRPTKDSTLEIVFPAGMTKLGFIHEGSLKTGAYGASTTYGHDATAFALSYSVLSDDLSGDGMTLSLAHQVVLTLPKGKDTADVSMPGHVSLDVPMGFQGFFLAGLRGRITRGKVVISRSSTDDGKRFDIAFGDMTIKK